MTPLEAEHAITAAIAGIEQLQKQMDKLTQAFELLTEKVKTLETQLSSSSRNRS